VFGTVRPPWTKYGSTYIHARSGNSEIQRRLAMYGRGSTAFRDVLFGWTHPAEVDVPADVGAFWTPHKAVVDPAAALKESGVGLATWTSWYIYGAAATWAGPPAWDVDALIDTTRLREALEYLLRRELPEDEFPPKNTREGRGGGARNETGSYESWYDDEMIEWVAEADRPLIDAFGFRPFKRSDVPVHWVGA
jgi:hypothetical protein